MDYVYDATNRLLSESITEAGQDTRTISYEYDKVGNRLTKTENGFTSTYQYDKNNRLVKEDDISYAYDADGNRVRKTIDNSVVINYLVDTNRDYAQVVEERDSNGNLLVRYVYGHDLISQTRPSAGSGSVTHYYHYDGLGSTRALTGQSGIVTDTYHYDAFGNLLDKSGVTVNTHLYTGEFFDSHLGFYYLRARYMNPSIGRFVTMDSFSGWKRDPYSLHKYLYAHANPVNMVDLSGRMSTYSEITVAGSIIGAMSGIYVYHITHAPEERDALGYVTWGAGGSLIGGLLAYGAYYIYLAPAANVAPQAGETLESLAARLEANANRVLAKLESVSHPNAHFFSRHGAQTTLAQQQVRATTGMTPDGVAGRIVDAGRFLTHRAQLRALERALTIFKQTGKRVFEFRMDEIIGEGFLRGGTAYAETSKVLAVFRDGKLLTLYPKLQ